jgi:hypothetical protein
MAPMDSPPGSTARGNVLLDRVMSALVYAALLIYLVYPYSDYDWGWHYRYGEYFLTHGRVLRRDIFSWTMPDFDWVNHSWLYDPLLYFLSNHISFFGLSLAGAVAGLLTFYLCVRRSRLQYWQTAVLAVFFGALSKEALMQGLRGQVIGLLLAAILIDLLFREREGQTWTYWAFPGLLCLWVNMHGSFLLGLVVFGVFVASDLVVLRLRGAVLPRRWIAFAGSLLASFVATLVNPFTYDVYLKGDVLSHAGNPMLRYVIEWQRPDFSEIVGMLFLGYVLLLVFGFVARRRLDDLPWLVLAALTLYLGVSSRRHVPAFMILTLPFAASVIRDMRFRVEGFARTSLVVAMMMATFGIAVFERRGQFQDMWRNPTRTYCSYGPNCSEGLTQYLLRQPPVGRGFNFYDWGGYMIGMGVKTKLFIDGRMALWERGDYRPMQDYRAIYILSDLDTFERQGFDWVIMPTSSTFVKQLVAYRSPWTGLSFDDVWAIAYRDDRALYLVRKRGR